MDNSVGFRLHTAHNRPERLLVSVCIANYNGAEYIASCIESVLGQGFPHPVEIIIHDDASTDGSVALLAERYPDVEMLVSVENVGFCVSNNRMVEHARGEYILLLNNDAMLRPGSLQAFLAEAERSGQPAILGLPEYSLTDGTLVDRGYEFDIFMNPIPMYRDGMREVGTVTGACMWIPREIWDAVGGFPDWFGSIAEDIYLCHAARLLGYRVMILDSPGFDHWIGKNLGGGKVLAAKLSTTVRRRIFSERNKTAVMLICAPWWTLLALVPMHAFALGAEALFLLLSGSGWSKVIGIYGKLWPWIWRNRGKILKQRDSLHSHRAISGLRYMQRFHLLPHKLRMFLRYGIPTLR